MLPASKGLLRTTTYGLDHLFDPTRTSGINIYIYKYISNYIYIMS